MSNVNTIFSRLKHEFFRRLIMKKLCFMFFACLFVFENSNGMLEGESMNFPISSVPAMTFYEVVNNRHMVRDFQKKEVPVDVLERVVDAGLRAPTHDHKREWEFVILKSEEEKRNALQFIAKGTAPQLEILEATLKAGTAQKEMYDIAMPRQYTMLYNASYVVLPFFNLTLE